MTKPRVLYILYHFPQISETYIRSEIEAVGDECELKIIGLHKADTPYRSHVPFEQTDDPFAIRAAIDEFRPHVLHTHWLTQVPTLAYFAGLCGGASARTPTPFTVRAHTVDVLDKGEQYVQRVAPFLNNELCLGVLSFPFTRSYYERAGVRGDKVHDCYPVVNYRRFHDRSPNGSAIMNVGACLPKKRMEDFVALAGMVPEREFNLYAMGYKVDSMRRLNETAGRPVNVIPPVEPEAMPAEYKKHAWLVYTAAFEKNTVGWPLAIAEAQAAGVGVCVPNLRPDLRDYVGPSGFLYDSIADVARVIARPPSEEVRQIGFEHAKESDVAVHKRLLTDLWRKAAGLPAPPPAQVIPSDDIADWVWRERYYTLVRELTAHVPVGGVVALADEAQLAASQFGRRTIPFPQRDGQYAGPPADDVEALNELRSSRRAGATHLAVAWPAFWWLDHYPAFAAQLQANFRCVLRNDRVILFDLNCGSAAGAAHG